MAEIGLQATLAPDRPAWHRQPKERERAWLAFQGFLAMEPPREVTRYAQQIQKPLATLYQWSSRWLWLDRASQYDGWLQRGRDEALVEQRREMNDRHAMLARAMSAKVAARIQALQPAELSPGEVGRWMQVISMVERLALGEATERVARDGSPDTVVNVTQEVQEVDALVVGPDYFAEVLERLRGAGVVTIDALPAPGGNGHAGTGSPAADADHPPDE